MNRLAFLASLIGLGGLVAKAQESGYITLQRAADPPPTTGGAGVTFTAPQRAPALLDLSPDRVVVSVEERLLGWFSKGKPTSNQCPLCGTMAEPYINPPLCLSSFSHNAGAVPCAPTERVTRCKRCGNAFFQDSK